MKIKINDSLVWDTENIENSDTRAWIASQLVQTAAECDRYGRPVRWLIEADDAIIEVCREYINPLGSSWARKCDTISVKPKGGER